MKSTFSPYEAAQKAYIAEIAQNSSFQRLIEAAAQSATVKFDDEQGQYYNFSEEILKEEVEMFIESKLDFSVALFEYAKSEVKNALGSAEEDRKDSMRQDREFKNSVM